MRRINFQRRPEVEGKKQHVSIREAWALVHGIRIAKGMGTRASRHRPNAHVPTGDFRTEKSILQMLQPSR